MKKKNRVLCICMCMMLAAFWLAGCSSRKTSTDDATAQNSHTDDSVTQNTKPDDTKEPDVTDGDTSVADDTLADDTTAQEEQPAGRGKTVALLLPAEDTDRWAQDAAVMTQALTNLGYTVQTAYAQDDPNKQAGQMEEFVQKNVDCIVITPVEPDAQKDVAVSAAKEGIPVIAYDRLLMQTDAVSFYVAFDSKGIGAAIGKEIIDQAGLDSLSDGEYKTVEFFMGLSQDRDALLLYNGLMEVLQPYLDDGRLVCNTGRTSFEDTCIQGDARETAKQRCGNYLAGYYTQEDLDICVAAADKSAYGCKEALLEAGYTQGNWPVISGQDCKALACKNILEGTQSFSIYKDTSLLAQQCAVLVDAVINGIEPDINDMEQSDNGVMIVPAHLCSPAIVNADNLQEIIVDSGYYTEKEIEDAQ